MRRMFMAVAGLAAMVLLGAADQEVKKAEATGVLGRMVHDSSGQQVGRVVDVVVDPSGGRARHRGGHGRVHGCGCPPGGGELDPGACAAAGQQG